MVAKASFKFTYLFHASEFFLPLKHIKISGRLEYHALLAFCCHCPLKIVIKVTLATDGVFKQ